MYSEIIENMTYSIEFYPLDEFVFNTFEVAQYFFPLFLTIVGYKIGCSLIKIACS